MARPESIPDSLKLALDNGVIKRLPVTFLPYVKQQLHEWDYLFPNERQSVERLLLYVASLSTDRLSVLFRGVVELEDKTRPINTPRLPGMRGPRAIGWCFWRFRGPLR
jgi:hypothetical protein